MIRGSDGLGLPTLWVLTLYKRFKQMHGIKNTTL